MNALVIYPVVLPLLAFAFCLLFSSHRTIQKGLHVFFSGSYLLLVSYLLFLEPSPKLQMSIGAWAEPFAITLAVDKLTELLLFVTGCIYFVFALYAVPKINLEDSPYVVPISSVMIAGISGAFITTDLFNLYVWFEVTLISSFVLGGLSREKLRVAGNVKYVLINIVSSLIFLLAAGITYNMTHTLNFKEVASRLQEISEMQPWLVTSLGMLLFLAFAIKSALFPFYTWLPASYHHLSPALSALFGGLLTKLGLYAIFRVSLTVFPTNDYLPIIISVLASVTMILGVLGAIVQTDIRRILSFHIVSQVGYIAMAGVLASSPEKSLQISGFAAAFFYMVHHILVKTNLFLVSGIIKAKTGTESTRQLGGMLTMFPWYAVAFAIPALSLAGIPPSSGFWAKFALIKAIVEAQYYIPAIAMIIAGFFTIYSMTKIWQEVYWGEARDTERYKYTSPLPLVSCLFLGLISLGIGFAPDFLMTEAVLAARQLVGS